jgi:hypothetical protein
MPPTIRKIHTYCQVLNAATAGFSYLLGTQEAFSLNGLYDPYLSGTGHQPYGFDEFAALYGRYKVVMADVTVSAFPASGNEAFVHAIVQGPNGGKTLTSAVTQEVMEIPQVITMAVPSSLKSAATFKRRVYFPDVIGMSKLEFDAAIEVYTADTNANPAKGIFLNVALSDSTGSSAAHVLEVRIDYHVDWFDRKIFASS